MTDLSYALTPAYAELFSVLSNANVYDVRTVFDHYISQQCRTSPSKITVVLRTDVDFACHLSLPLASILNTYNLRCSFYFLPHLCYYNIYANDLLQKISYLGHEIGIHSDHLYQSLISGNNALSELQADIQRLQDHGISVHGMCCHSHTAIEALGLLNWDLIKDIDPIDLNLKYSDGFKGKYIDPSSSIWKPACDLQLADYLGFPSSWGWNYLPSLPLKQLSSASIGSVVHIGFHNHNCFKYWLNWDYSFNESPLISDSLFDFYYKKLRIYDWYVLRPRLRRFFPPTPNSQS